MLHSLTSQPASAARFTQLFTSYRDGLAALDGSPSDHDQASGEVWIKSSSPEHWATPSDLKRGAQLHQQQDLTKVRITGKNADNSRDVKLELTETSHWLTVTGLEETRNPGEARRTDIETFGYCPSTGETYSERGHALDGQGYQVDERGGTSLLDKLADEFILSH